MKACTANRCQQGRAPCPCPQACELPEPCDTWRPGAGRHTTRTTAAAELRALAAHAGAVALAVWALVFIVKTAAGA